MEQKENTVQPMPPMPYAGPVVLASNSPRRRQLLGLIVPEFTIAPPREVEEKYPSGLRAEEVAPYLSRLKAQAYGDLVRAQGNPLVITADTVVINDGKILGKPHGEAEAVEMLESLSGRSHTVVTGVTLHTYQKIQTFAEHTQVHFASLATEEIEEYVRRFRPLDKAGAYGIQEWIGCMGIRGIDGCFYNVMGLPLHTLYAHLRQM